MLVRDVMTCRVRSCPPDATVADAARIMSARDCGIIPVVDAARKLVGVVTDRDVCLAVAGRVRNPAALLVADVMARTVYACSADHDTAAALKVMKRHLVRRLPVLDSYARLVGILSVDDLVARMGDGPDADIAPESVIDTLKALSARAVAR